MPGQWTRRLGSCSSQARALSTVRRQSHATPTPPLKGDELGPTQQHGHRTFRTRRDGRKELPLPPLLDPVVLEERSRHEQKKEKPRPADFTPFQRRLWENAFAHALASPVRECRATQAFVPEALLTALHMRPHPTTGDPWLLPVSLTTVKKQLGAPLRFLTRHLVAAQLGRRKGWEKALYPRIIDKFRPGDFAKTVWREDMPALLLDLLRNRLVDRLSWHFSFRGRLVPVTSPHANHTAPVDDVSTVLVFGSLRTRADDCQARLEAITAELEKWATYFGQNFGARFDPHAAPDVTHHPPGWYAQPLVPHMQPRLQFPELDFKTAIWRRRKVAVYSLTDLLGPDKAKELIEGPKSKYAGRTCVVMKRAKHNVPVEILLMQLQAYTTRPGA
ncbi:uncharacterized protein EKO05_0009577 [Ascochyta rabiei]|uniref:Uncharacterized protein n=1 Tax=Didymella rabiei TaxID=5454 RepID=A0A163CNJ0_DIDRA|nr:uncharacterized protein EKO05_0009577 [Ascochyta rabiei]KZM22588.1 hypothetical protein ST47_g6294 [Ascochyta rabiei]UPX19309.1 hypothetical protein EKO05_0009577 [Ascochyta rabiei]